MLSTTSTCTAIHVLYRGARHRIIPRAIDWFTGKALEYEGMRETDGGFEMDDDEEEEDDDDDNDEDEIPVCARGGPPRNGGRAGAQNINPKEDCKQQQLMEASMVVARVVQAGNPNGNVARGLHENCEYGSGAGKVSGIFRGTSKTFSNLTLKTGSLIDETIIQGAGSAACDILISISLCWVFDAHRSGNKRTDSLIDRLMFYAINRGIATSVCALLGVFLYNFVSGTYYFLIPLLANTHLYVISTISILNLRGVPVDSQKDQPFHLSDLYLTTIVGADRGNGKSSRRADSLEVKV
ncbi:hypothetical protein M422DRAFT_268713 [Sphaerobolus stellatus SS14]|uniref:DUF6534 domain-containing protein n=1 Tax=Sphaerobolus stellatus (strain SS14) TaxID=990650 RepID=A0A0C9U6E0_SPHS4|nr:hypothetical protein M422DRAFT_268713 [Sphaerobolus stellatus SS14]